ncbi:MAG TPA: crossover junction endodeoxyribonuclease RuvC [Spirochaetota bacterium]|nr:crossover junction endodeoxyribonuclease RuvC [Spirochaetota bacterium]
MIVIGIDPGIERTGIGIVENIRGKSNLIFSELIKTNSKLSTSERLAIIFQTLNRITDLYKIDSASVEKLFFAKNTKTAMVVSEARGVLLLSLQLKNIPIYEYTPLQVKQALTGYGSGTKEQVHNLVKIILNLKDLSKQDDVSDGIALAITHIHSQKSYL